VSVGRHALLPLYRRAEASAFRDVAHALRDLAWEGRAWAAHQLAVRRAQSISGRRLRLHIGCGADVRSGWLNIDLEPAADLRLDLRRPLPFADDSVSLIFGEHVFEHFELPDARSLLREAYRVLTPGGKLSLSVPDAEQLIREYATGDGPLLRQARGDHGWHVAAATPLDQLNQLFRQGGQHRYAWDALTFLHYLREAGFDAHERQFDPQLDSEGRRDESLYVEGLKPIS
jgi:predicted SAM-dependent methyltransferase